MSQREWLAAAEAAAKMAYAPYSGFRVGAVLITADGSTFAGCNVENAAYPEGTCAEAGALAAMVLAGSVSLKAVVTYGVDADRPVTPCGGCRQKLAEFGGQDTLVICGAPDLEAEQFKLADLLPAAFAVGDSEPFDP